MRRTKLFFYIFPLMVVVLGGCSSSSILKTVESSPYEAVESSPDEAAEGIAPLSFELLALEELKGQADARKVIIEDSRSLERQEDALVGLEDDTGEDIIGSADYSSRLYASPEEPLSKPLGSEEHDKKIKTHINLTPLSTYEDDWVTNEPAIESSFSDSYTRLIVISDLWADGNNAVQEGDDSSKEPSKLPYNTRNWLRRWLVGRVFSINLTANITVGTFESTVPLATIGHQSNSDGEQWNRVVHHTKSNFPLFLVKSDGSASIPVIRLSVNGANTYSSQGAAAAVQVALGVAKATGQAASVVTRLSEQSTKDRSRAIDQAISKLFGSGINEEHWTDRDLRRWSVSKENRPNGVRVRFSIPSKEGDWNSTPLDVGVWVLTFDYPRPSIFSDWYVCGHDKLPRCANNRAEAERNILTEINEGQVLSYALVNGDQGLGTIRAYLAQQDWYNSAQALLADQDTDISEAAAASLCKKITNEITSLGLNGFDAKIVVWAVTKGMPLPARSPVFATITGCKNSIEAVEDYRK